MLRHYALFAGALASLFILGEFHKSFAATTDACSLLTASEVSTALEIKSMPGKPVVPGSSKSCVWSDAADAGISSRRVTVSISSSTTAFTLMKSSPRITIETASGIGDESFYEIPKGGETPILQVRKGGAVFTLRILNGLKSKALAREVVKEREAALAKAAAGRF